MNRRFIYIISLLVFVVSLKGQNGKSKKVSSINGKKYYVHSVEKGQSLYAISKLYSVDINTILLENPSAVDGIKKDQVLNIPFKDEELPSVSSVADFEKYEVHKVQKGESLYFISKKYGVSDKVLMELNQLDERKLKEGQLLKIKVKSASSVNQPIINLNPSPQDSIYYTVEKGETIYALCKKHNIKQEDLAKWNPSLSSGLKTGQRIVIGIKNNSTPVAHSDTIVEVKPAKQKKQTYEIGLFLPFQLAEVDYIKVEDMAINKVPFPATQSVTIDFYEGILLAIDSLESDSFKIKLRLYDTNEKDSSAQGINQYEESIKKHDLIIGPLFNNKFKALSELTRVMEIPIVSPLTTANKVLFNNPYSSKTIASNTSLLESFSEFCVDSFHGQNVVVVNTNKPKEQSGISTFKMHYNEYLNNKYKALKDSIRETNGIAGAKAAYDPSKKNYFVVLSEDEVFITDFMTQMNVFTGDKKTLNVLGLRRWISIDHIDPEYLNKFSFTYPCSYFIDQQDPIVKSMKLVYRKKYFTDPSDYYYQGFDIAYFYLSSLKKQGPEFINNLIYTKEKGVCLDFDFYRPTENTGFDNRAIRVVKYQDYTFKKVK